MQINLTNENQWYMNLSIEKAIPSNAMDFGIFMNRFNIDLIHALFIDRLKELFLKDKLELTKSTAFFINSSRRKIIYLTALIGVLEKKE